MSSTKTLEKMDKTLTIEFEGVELEITGYYEPYDAGVMYHSDMSGTPPSGATFEIEEVLVNGVNIFPLIDHHEDALNERILEHLEGN